MGMLLCSPAGNDILYDDKLVEQGRNFCNKLWNALRLLQGWEVTEGENQENKVIIEWLEGKLDTTINELNASYTDFRLSEALMTIYKFIWDDFCSWYLELIKPDYGAPIDSYTYNKTKELFDKIVRLLHPFMPFVTEEIWHVLAERKEGESICIAQLPKSSAAINTQLLDEASLSFDIITAIREIRAKAGKKNTENVQAYYNGSDAVKFSAFQSKILKLARLDVLEQVSEDMPKSKTFIAKGYKFFVITGEQEDAGAEREKLLKELEYAKGFLASVEKKLSNEKFVNSAPAAVLDGERKKKEDAMQKIKMLEASLN